MEPRLGQFTCCGRETTHPYKSDFDESNDKGINSLQKPSHAFQTCKSCRICTLMEKVHRPSNEVLKMLDTPTIHNGVQHVASLGFQLFIKITSSCGSTLIGSIFPSKKYPTRDRLIYFAGQKLSGRNLLSAFSISFQKCKSMFSEQNCP